MTSARGSCTTTQTIADYRIRECWMASQRLIEVAKTGESADIAFATAIVERVLRRLL